MTRVLGGDAEVIVVGGGPAGAATAFFLASAGIDVLVLDRARFPRDKPCSEYLSPEASRLLAAMGALDAVEHAGAARLAGMVIRSPGGVSLRGDFVAAHGFRAFRDSGLAIRRTLLDAILLDRARAAGARVEEGVRVTALARGASRDGATRSHAWDVDALDSAGAVVRRRARFVIGADGLRSVVGRRLGLSRRSWWPRRLALVTHYRGVADVGDCGEMHVERDGYLGIADVGGGETNVAVVVPESRALELSAGREAFLGRWFRRRPALAARFAHAERVSPMTVTGPFATAARRAWAPGAALVGDAADFYDPFTGEGIYAALRGAEMLVPAVLDALQSPSARRERAALREYGRARRREFGGKWLVERLVGAAVALPPLMDRAARVLAARKDMADLLVGVTGDFVPPREVLRPAFLYALLLQPVRPS
jgi:flavin-dependent dehydrogenase